MTEAIELTLKQGGMWSGLSYESELMPTTGRFSRLKGCYHSPDGTELIRWPGMALVAEPGYAEPVSGDLTTVAGQARFTGASGSYGGFILMEESTIKARNVFLTNVGGPNNLPSGWYLTRVTNATNLIETLVASAGNNVGGDDAAYLSRIQKRDAGNLLHIHDLRAIFGYPAIVFDANIFYSKTIAVDPAHSPGFVHQQSAAVYLGNRLFDFDSPHSVGDFTYLPSIPLALILGDMDIARATIVAYTDGDVATPGTTTPYALMPWWRRAQLESFDGHLIVAVPGYGCCFHFDHKIAIRDMLGEPPSSGWSGRLDALGIPKAVLHNLAFVDNAGTGTIPADNWVSVQIAYYNSRTGRYGLVSEKITKKAGAGVNKSAVLTVLHPRWVMRETDADTIVIWGSAPGATADEVVLLPKRYVNVGRTLGHVLVPPPNDNALLTLTTYDSAVDTGETRTDQRIVPRLTQMPMGATAAVAIKGHVMLAGQLHEEIAADDSFVFLPFSDTGIALKFIDVVNLCGHGLPASYEGSVEAGGFSLAATGYNRLTEWIGQGLVPIAPYYYMARYRQATPGGLVGIGARPAHIVKGHVQFTTQERPGECPAPQRAIADRLAGRDVIALGRWGDTMIFCTEFETYALSISQTPIGVEPTLLSSEYGAISPVMVQTDMGLTWLSHRGPVSFHGGQPTLHRQVEHLFRRVHATEMGLVRTKLFARDRKGFMFHHRAMHDRTRRLVYHLLRTDQHSAAYADAAYLYKVQDYVAGPPNTLTLEIGQMGPYRPIGAKMLCRIKRGGVTIYTGRAEILDHELAAGCKLRLAPQPATPPAGNDVFECYTDWAKSKVGADVCLVHSYTTDSFALMEWPGDHLWQAAAETQFVDGTFKPVWITERMHAVATPKPAGAAPETLPVYEVELQGAIFGMDDNFADRLKEPVVAVATRPPFITGGFTYFEAKNTDFRTLLRGDFFTNKSIIYEAFIRSATPDSRGNYELKWWGSVDAVATSAAAPPTPQDRLRLKLDPAKPSPVWVAGDVMEIGVTHIELETLKLNVPDLGDARDQRKYGQTVRGLVLEHTFRRELNTQQKPVVGWAYAEGYGDGAWVRLHSELWGHPLQATTQVSRVVGGMAVGRETAIRLAIISNAQVRLKDVRLDLGTGGR